MKHDLSGLHPTSLFYIAQINTHRIPMMLVPMVIMRVCNKKKVRVWTNSSMARIHSVSVGNSCPAVNSRTISRDPVLLPEIPAPEGFEIRYIFLNWEYFSLEHVARTTVMFGYSFIKYWVGFIPDRDHNPIPSFKQITPRKHHFWLTYPCWSVFTRPKTTIYILYIYTLW